MGFEKRCVNALRVSDNLKILQAHTDTLLIGF